MTEWKSSAFDRRVNSLASRHGWNITPVHDRYIPCYSIVPMDRQERDRITAALNRCKALHIKVEQVFSPYAWSCAIYIFDRAEWEARQERNCKEQAITDAFTWAYHINGHDSANAKAAAKAKAAELDALDVFGQMYRTA